MEQARKNLRNSSVMVLIFAAFSLINIVLELVFGELNFAENPEGSPDNILLITKVFLLTFSVLCLLPRFYMGVKGLRIAKNPDSSKAHIIWATIIFVILVLEFIPPVLGIVRQENILENVSTLAGVLLDVVICFEYIRYAKAVLKEV